MRQMITDPQTNLLNRLLLNIANNFSFRIWTRIHSDLPMNGCMGQIHVAKNREQQATHFLVFNASLPANIGVHWLISYHGAGSIERHLKPKGGASFAKI